MIRIILCFDVPTNPLFLLCINYYMKKKWCRFIEYIMYINSIFYKNFGYCFLIFLSFPYSWRAEEDTIVNFPTVRMKRRMPIWVKRKGAKENLAML